MGLSAEGVVFGGGYPDYKVGPNAEEAEEDGDQEEDPDYRWVDVEVAGYAAADAGNAAVGGAAGESFVIFHSLGCFIGSPKIS